MIGVVLFQLRRVFYISPIVGICNRSRSKFLTKRYVKTASAPERGSKGVTAVEKKSRGLLGPGTSLGRLDRLSIKSRRGVNTTKYSGIIKLNKDPLQIQKDLRNEWKSLGRR